jgi:hypothetical protein
MELSLFEKLPVVHLLKNYLTLYGTRSFITVLKKLSTGPYPEPEQFSPYHLIRFLSGPFQYYSPIYVLVFLVVSFLLPFPPKSYMHSYYLTLVLYALPISSSLTW